MTRRVTPELLAVCLADIRSGRATIEDCIAAYPDVGNELGSLLALALSISVLPPIAPDPSFRVRTRSMLIATINAEKKSVTMSPLERFWKVRIGDRQRPVHLLVGRMGMPALIIALIIAITTATGGGAAYASQGTLPGETLYPVKIALEQLQLNLASGDEGKAQTYIELADKRMSEAERAIELGNSSAGETAAEAFVTAVVEANQHLANAAGSGKDVSGLVARLAANVSRHEEILAAIEVRAPAKAKDALTRAAVAAEKGPKRAGTLVLEEPTSSPTASVTPTPSGSPTATVSPSATVVVSPTATATAVATGTVSNTVLITLTQTISNVQLLETDPNVSGQSYEGLIAKLNAAEQAIGREQPEVAARQLDAFLNQLNAFRNAGHISAENYNTLYESYLILVNSLGGSQKPQSAVTPSSHAGGNKTEPISTATARPARPEPTPRGKR